MSLPVMVWVMKSSEERLGRRLVLLALAEFAHDDGTRAFPTVETISRRARLSESQTRTSLRELERSGAIECTGTTSKGVRIYSVLMGGPESGGVGNDAEGGRSTSERGPESGPDPGEGPGEGPGDARAAREGPPPAILIDGRNRPRDVLAEVCGVEEGSPRERSLNAALNGSREVGPGIRALVWTLIAPATMRESLAAQSEKEVVDSIRRDFDALVVEEIRRRAKLYRERFKDAELTPTALAKWFVDVGSRRRESAGSNRSGDVDAPEPLPEPATPEERAAIAEKLRELTAGIGKEV